MLSRNVSTDFFGRHGSEVTWSWKIALVPVPWPTKSVFEHLFFLDLLFMSSLERSIHKEEVLLEDGVQWLEDRSVPSLSRPFSA